jgi:hypothetical protein
MSFNNFGNFPPVILFVVLVWSAFWKVLALWRASKNNQKYWFIALFLLNTIGIADILYLFYFAKKKITLKDIKTSNFLP